jgi:ACR3 family arsenite efflux pump ArsB
LNTLEIILLVFVLIPLVASVSTLVILKKDARFKLIRRLAIVISIVELCIVLYFTVAAIVMSGGFTII